MRRLRLLVLAIALGLLLAATAIPLRQLEANGRATALARAVNAGNRAGVEAMLARGANPNTLVAYHYPAGVPTVSAYQSLAHFAKERGDPKMAALLEQHGGVARWESPPIPEFLEMATEQTQLKKQKSPWVRLWERLIWRYGRPDGPPKVDLQVGTWQAKGYAEVAVALLFLGGALRMAGLGLPRSADPVRTQRSLAQGIGLIFLGAILCVAVFYLAP